MQEIQLKRVYEGVSPEDGFRVYVDRLWPRGLSHETFHYDYWAKEVAPSTALREWFHENRAVEWAEFEDRYRKELASNPAFESLRELLKGKERVTLLYSSKDTEHNNALVLREELLK